MASTFSTSRAITVNSAAGSTVDVTGLAATFAGQIAGNGALAVQGAGGTLTFAGDNSGFSGGENLVSGTLAVTTLANLGTGDLSFQGGKTMILSWDDEKGAEFIRDHAPK